MTGDGWLYSAAIEYSAGASESVGSLLVLFRKIHEQILLLECRGMVAWGGVGEKGAAPVEFPPAGQGRQAMQCSTWDGVE